MDLKLVMWPSPKLAEVSKPVEEFGDSLKPLIEEMATLMLREGGVGLSAIQVGNPIRLFVMGNAAEYVEYINPEIVQKSEKLVSMPEGCLSFRDGSVGIYDRIERPEFIHAKWQNLKGEWQQQTFSGLWARCFQHELDHLDGLTFERLMTPIAQKRLRKQFARKEK